MQIIYNGYIETTLTDTNGNICKINTDDVLYKEGFRRIYIITTIKDTDLTPGWRGSIVRQSVGGEDIVSGDKIPGVVLVKHNDTTLIDVRLKYIRDGFIYWEYVFKK